LKKKEAEKLHGYWFVGTNNARESNLGKSIRFSVFVLLTHANLVTD